MKVLSLSAGTNSGDAHQFTHSTLKDATPFGYDLIVVNPHNIQGLYGSNNRGSVQARWRNAIKKWSSGKRKIIIYMDALETEGLMWLPLNQDALNTFAGLEAVGSSNYLGNVTSIEPVLRHFLTQNKQHFTINTYLKYDDPNQNITVHSGVDETLVTSFTYKDDFIELIFIPRLPLANLVGLINTLDQPASSWGVSSADEINQQISDIDAQINELYSSRDTLNEELGRLNASISTTIESDVYLTRAISHYDASKSTENPSPESYYGAIEAIENAFDSERDMREKLDLSKAYIDKVMRRANEFRHEAKSGQPATPLTAEEIADLSERVNKVISSYIQYLLNS
jgi:hypothetical protein